MNKGSYQVLAGLLLGFWGFLLEAQGPKGDALGEPIEAGKEPKKVYIAYLRPGDGLIDADVATRFIADLDDRLRREPDIAFVVLRIQSRGVRGGDLEPAEAIAEKLHNLRGVRTIAHIDAGEALGNGATLIAMACQRLAMVQDARIGAIDDTEGAVPDAKEPDARQARVLLQRDASLRRPNVPPALVHSLVSTFHGEVYKVTYEKVEGGRKHSETRYLSKELLDEELKDAVKKQQIREHVVVLKPGERSTLSAIQAKDYGIADVLLANAFDAGGRAELFEKLDIDVGQENVIDHYQGTLKPRSALSQAMVDLLNHPITRFLLVLIACLGLVLELKMPGTFVPLATSAVCFLLIFVGGSFPAQAVTGSSMPTTSPFEIALFVTGMALVLVEFLLLPGVIFFGLLGVGLVLVSLTLAMVPPADAASPESMTFQEALTSLVLALGSGLGAFFLLLKLLPRNRLFHRLGMVASSATIDGVPTADSILEEQARNARLLGKVGIAVTPLRPSGKIEMDGQSVDVVAEGDFIDMGGKVQIIEASPLRVVVVRVEDEVGDDPPRGGAAV
jgi:membrane-bound serine protease (ClpP class)